MAELLKYLVEHPGAMRTAGIALSLLILGPIIIVWLRAGYIRKTSKAYGLLFDDLSTKVGDLYRDITQMQEDLARTRGELSEAKSQLAAAEAVSKRQQGQLNNQKDEISRLRKRVAELQNTEQKLLIEIKRHEKGH